MDTLFYEARVSDSSTMWQIYVEEISHIGAVHEVAWKWASKDVWNCHRESWQALPDELLNKIDYEVLFESSVESGRHDVKLGKPAGICARIGMLRTEDDFLDGGEIRLQERNDGPCATRFTHNIAESLEKPASAGRDRWNVPGVEGVHYTCTEEGGVVGTSTQRHPESW